MPLQLYGQQTITNYEIHVLNCLQNVLMTHMVLTVSLAHRTVKIYVTSFLKLVFALEDV